MSESPPHNIEAEESVLGAILLGERIPNELLEELSARKFFRDSHGTIYNAALSLHTQGKPTSLITVADQLDKMGQLDKAGGHSRLCELAALVPTVSNAGHHAKIVSEMSSLRELLFAGQTIQQLATDRPGEMDELIRRAENALHAATHGTSTRSAVALTEGLDDLIDSIRQAYSSGIPNSGLPTGFKSLDNILNGLWPSQLVLIAARTGVGKTTLAQNIAENVSDSGWPVLFVSLEMSRHELQIRALSRAGRIDGFRLEDGQLTPDEAQRLGGAIEIVKERSNILVHDDGLATPSTLASLARRHNEQERLGLIVVDYIGLMKGDGANKYEQVSDVSRSLKMLAQTLKVPVLALAQMNRKQDGRMDKAPMLSDLRDSGSLEQDADVVIFLHRESDHDTDIAADGSMDIIVEKNRKGRRGKATMLFTERYSRFVETRTGPGGTP